MAKKCLSQNEHKPLLVSSEAAHYSIAKAADILGLHYCLIKTSNNDEVDYEELENFIKKHAQYPIIFVLNLGTTMTGAIDSPTLIINILKKYSNNYYIHADGALHGMYYPFMKDHKNLFDLGVNSISISGHKFLGTLQPCGIFLTKKSTHQSAFNRRGKISYINVQDTPISGSRDGMQSLRMWVRLKKMGIPGLQEKYQKSIFLAHYFKERLIKKEIKGIIYFPNQTIVTFPAPPLEIAKKYQLPIDSKGRSHIVFRSDMTTTQIDEFLTEYKLA